MKQNSGNSKLQMEIHVCRTKEGTPLCSALVPEFGGGPCVVKTLGEQLKNRVITPGSMEEVRRLAGKIGNTKKIAVNKDTGEFAVVCGTSDQELLERSGFPKGTEIVKGGLIFKLPEKG